MEYGYRMAQQHVLEEDYDENYEPTEEGEKDTARAWREIQKNLPVAMDTCGKILGF